MLKESAVTSIATTVELNKGKGIKMSAVNAQGLFLFTSVKQAYGNYSMMQDVKKTYDLKA